MIAISVPGNGAGVVNGGPDGKTTETLTGVSFSGSLGAVVVGAGVVDGGPGGKTMETVTGVLFFGSLGAAVGSCVGTIVGSPGDTGGLGLGASFRI